MSRLNTNRLNVTRGVSLSHDTTATSNPSVTTNINIHSQTLEPSSSQVEYPEVKPISQMSVKERATEVISTALQSSAFNDVNEVEFLKGVINIYMSEPFTYKGKAIICTADELGQLVHTLTGGSVTVDTAEIDIDCGCCSGEDLPIKSVSKIWVTIDDETTVFRYSYPQYLTLFETYKISLKYVHE